MAGVKTPSGERVGVAHVHSSKGNRRATSAKEKTKAQLETRTVFKAALDNPFDVKWPIVPPNVQNALLARLSTLLAGVADYNAVRHSARPSQKKKSAKLNARLKTKSTSKRPVATAASDLNKHEQQADAATKTAAGEDGELAPADLRPAALDHIAVGINAVTKRLETRCRIVRTPLAPALPPTSTTDADGDTAMPAASTSVISTQSNLQPKASSSTEKSSTDPLPLRAVFVCRADLNTPQLVGHIPALIAAVNSRLLGSRSRDERAQQSSGETQHQDSEPESGMIMERRLTPMDTERVVLALLPRGAEDTLKQVLGLRHVAALAVDDELARDPILSALLAQIPTVTAPWLVPIPAPAPAPMPSSSSSSTKNAEAQRTRVHAPTHPGLTPTHIAHRRTTAPKDMRAAKAARASGRAAAKAKRRAALGSTKASTADSQARADAKAKRSRAKKTGKAKDAVKGVEMKKKGLPQWRDEELWRPHGIDVTGGIHKVVVSATKDTKRPFWER